MPNKPLLIFDGDCFFCRTWIERWQRITGNRVEYAPYQEVSPQFPQIPLKNFQKSVQLVLPSGEIFAGAEAVFRSLAVVPRQRGWLWLYQHVPGFKPVSEWGYELVAGHRPFFSRLTHWLLGPVVEPRAHLLSRWIFLRLMGVIYLVAFISLGIQVPGLYGHEGILPIAPFLDAVAERFGPDRFFVLPTVFWWGASDTALRAVWVAGSVCAGMLLTGCAPVIGAVGAWACYLSFVSVGRDFLSFQWDILLLETGFLTIFLAPFQLRPRLEHEAPPSTMVVWLIRLLLFRLMLLSGLVKLLSQDESWWNLTALMVHYETQPLPTWIGWYVHQLSAWFQKLSAGTLFFVELVVPFFLLGPRRWRNIAAWTTLVFQTLILLTGNYCFFNWLTIALCLMSMDDGIYPRRLIKKVQGLRDWSPDFPAMGWPRWILLPTTAVLLLFSGVVFSYRVGLKIPWPKPVMLLFQELEPFRLVNSYGLFAVMTTSRPEIVVEGSSDGKIWLPYVFKYKPGEITKAPAFVAPHQPRLDWQMWFAALGDYRQNPWFIQFCLKLLQGSKEVTALLKTNPFPLEPPRYVRGVVYDYRFTEFSTKRESGQWWRRERKGDYCPVLSLRD